MAEMLPWHDRLRCAVQPLVLWHALSAGIWRLESCRGLSMTWLYLEADVLRKSRKSHTGCLARSAIQEGGIQPNAVLYNSAISVAEKAGTSLGVG